MNQQPKDNTRMLPSISNLLISSPSSSFYAKKSDPPTVNLSPASPVLSLPSTPPHTAKSPTSYLSLDNRTTRYSSISPILSPIDSPSSSPYLSSGNNNNVQYLSLNNHLPPLQGDDPPQRLRLPSPSSPITPKSLFNSNNTNTTWNNNNNNNNNISNHYSPSPSCSSTSSSCSTTVSFEDASCASIESSPSLPTLEHFSAPPPPVVRSTARNTTTTVSPIPNTQIVFDSSGQPVLKRRRGRPPTCNNNFENGGWTFLTPTVWDIHVSEEQKERELKADNDLLLKSQQQQQQQSQQHEQVHILDDTIMNDSMNAFTNSNMDTILQMPRKKRGRKPKTHIAGNSCFVWKDLTSTRSVAVKK